MTMRVIGFIQNNNIRSLLAVISLFTIAACSSQSEEQLVQVGIGTNLYEDNFRDVVVKEELYLGLLCFQAGAPWTEYDLSGSSEDIICDRAKMHPQHWDLVARAGFNDIDRRCDAYLAWLNSRRRNQSAFLNQIRDTRSFVEAILNITGGSATAITAAGLAIGYSANTFNNFYSRLILEVERSTVELVVHQKRLHFRGKLNASKARVISRPDAVYVLREYLLICTPHHIESIINQRTRDSISGNTPADRNDPEEVSKSLISRTFYNDIPKGGSREQFERSGENNKNNRKGNSGGNTDEKKIKSAANTYESAIGLSRGKLIQRNLCLSSENQTGNFGSITRRAIRQFEWALYEDNAKINGEIDSEKEEGEIIRFDSGCEQSNGRMYRNVYEKFKFRAPLESDEINRVKGFQNTLYAALKQQNVDKLEETFGKEGSFASGSFDDKTREAIGEISEIVAAKKADDYDQIKQEAKDLDIKDFNKELTPHLRRMVGRARVKKL